jgi:hypothetical protein
MITFHSHGEATNLARVVVPLTSQSRICSSLRALGRLLWEVVKTKPLPLPQAPTVPLILHDSNLRAAIQ